MQDVQNLPDRRRLAIDRVGVRDLRYPIMVRDQRHGWQATVAELTLAVSLPQQFKGTHMSRFIETLQRHCGELTMHTLPAILADLKRVLHAESAHLTARFPYFVEKAAPASGARALIDYVCTFTGDSGPAGHDFVLGVRVPVMSVCPCSKAISDYGAHNQRGYLQLSVRTALAADGTPAFVWLEELVAIAEAAASSPVYPLLKRSDERAVTMAAHDRPVFVEDMVRGVAAELRADPRITWFDVEAVNLESIHNHSAFAQITWSRPLKSRRAPHGPTNRATTQVRTARTPRTRRKKPAT